MNLVRGFVVGEYIWTSFDLRGVKIERRNKTRSYDRKKQSSSKSALYQSGWSWVFSLLDDRRRLREYIELVKFYQGFENDIVCDGINGHVWCSSVAEEEQEEKESKKCFIPY